MTIHNDDKHPLPTDTVYFISLIRYPDPTCVYRKANTVIEIKNSDLAQRLSQHKRSVQLYSLRREHVDKHNSTDVRMNVETVDFETTPLHALSASTRNRLATYLDAEKVVRTSNGLWRDWRGILDLCDLYTSIEPIISSRGNPTMDLINILEKEPYNITFANYLKMLEDIDRWDVVDDTLQLFVNDARHYWRQQEEFNRRREELVDASSEQINRNCLTTHDLFRVTKNLPPQHYDAFILFADEDEDFAMELDAKVKEFGFKSCVKGDFLAGLSFEHDTIRQLLTERCNLLVVIISPDFVCSALNEYITNLAQSLAITQRTRKIIPCLYKPCEIPENLKHVTPLNYLKSKKFYNFWNQLNISLQPLPVEPGERKAKQCPQITIPAITPVIAVPEDVNSPATRSSNRKKRPILSKIRSATSKFGRKTSKVIFRLLNASELEIWKYDFRHL